MEYKLTFLKGSPFVDYGDGLMFIDSGLKYSIADARSIAFAGVAVPINNRFANINTAVLADWFERPVVGAIGCDLLLRYPIKIDYKAGLLTVGYDGPVGERTGKIYDGAPMVELSIDGHDCRCFIDTGAQYSYILQRLVEGNPVQGRVEDCAWGDPGNSYETNLYETVFECNGVKYAVGCAALSPSLDFQLGRIGVSGVIGKDFFDHHAIVIRDGVVYARNYF